MRVYVVTRDDDDRSSNVVGVRRTRRAARELADTHHHNDGEANHRLNWRYDRKTQESTARVFGWRSGWYVTTPFDLPDA